jgi:hypothetical protein
MNTVERITFAACLLLGGIAIGMYYEHQRFIKEVQGLHKKHSDEPPQPDAPTPSPDKESAA